MEITSLRGGMNDSDPPIALAEDQCTLAQNVEFHRSTLGERRRGAAAIDLTGSPLAVCDRIVWAHRHPPTTHQKDAQYWALGIVDSGPSAVLAYKDTTWHTVTMADALTIDGVSEYQIEGQTLHRKLFIAYKSAVDRLHVWDGTSLRRAGLTVLSTAPTAVDSGSGTFASTRYYRARETVQVSGTTILRSEPSDVLTFSPSGSGSGATVTKPATVNSNATHWELEASLDNANFYPIATTAIGTATVTDTIAAGTGYATVDVSEDIGDYEPPHSARHLLADEDRLLLFGAFEDADLDSSVSWTPVFNATGVGNDERITLDPTSNLNLDGSEGGSITDVGRWAAGEIGVAKESHIYKLIRTGELAPAYQAFAESKVVGALPGSMVEGIDEGGNAALYFLDPAVGPYRYMVQRGLQYCGRDVWETWQTVNTDATKVPARSFYYRTTQQVHWRVPTGTDTVPTIGLVLQTNEMRSAEGGEARRGFSVWTGPSCAALAVCLFSSNIDAGTDRSRDLVPLVGVEGGGLIWQTDTGEDDNGTEYAARITTKPYHADLQTTFEIKTATVVGKAVDGATLIVSVIPDFGTTTTKMGEPLDFTPLGDEAHVTRFMDDLGIAECTVAQIDFADTDTPGERWELARCALTVSAGQGS